MQMVARPYVRRLATTHRGAAVETLKAAAELLNAGKKVVILAGLGGPRRRRRAGATWPTSWPLRSSSRCWARRRVPDDSPFTTGGVGLLGTRPSELAMEECDALLMVGTSFPYLKWYPKPGQAKARADRYRPDAHRPPLSGGHRAGRRCQGDAAGALAAAHSPRRTARSWRRPRPE